MTTGGPLLREWLVNGGAEKHESPCPPKRAGLYRSRRTNVLFLELSSQMTLSEGHK